METDFARAAKKLGLSIFITPFLSIVVGLIVTVNSMGAYGEAPNSGWQLIGNELIWIFMLFFNTVLLMGPVYAFLMVSSIIIMLLKKYYKTALILLGFLLLTSLFISLLYFAFIFNPY